MGNNDILKSFFRVYTEPGKPGKYAILAKGQERPEIVVEVSILLIQVREKLFSKRIIFINYWHSCSQSRVFNYFE